MDGERTTFGSGRGERGARLAPEGGDGDLAVLCELADDRLGLAVGRRGGPLALLLRRRGALPLLAGGLVVVVDEVVVLLWGHAGQTSKELRLISSRGRSHAQWELGSKEKQSCCRVFSLLGSPKATLRGSRRASRTLLRFMVQEVLRGDADAARRCEGPCVCPSERLPGVRAGLAGASRRESAPLTFARPLLNDDRGGGCDSDS